MRSNSTADGPRSPIVITDYVPGVCNIGPAEIARRRRSGHVGLIAAIVLYVVLVFLDVDPLVRFVVALPGAAAATGYLQAHFRFCAGFGSRGIVNFGELGEDQRVAEAADRARDRRRSAEIFLASAGIGVLVGAIAVLLPL